MFIVRKLSTGKIHITRKIDSHKTLCGQRCQSNIINDFNNGFGRIKDPANLLNVPKVTCKKCLKLNK